MIVPNDTLLMDVFRSRFQPQQLRGKSAHTTSLHRTTIEWFSQHLGRPATVADLTDDNAAAFFLWIENTPGPRGKIRDARTVNNRRSYLFAFWRWCARKGIVPCWPDVPALPEPPKNPEAWRMEELARLFHACENAGERPVKGVRSPIPAREWWLAMHRIWWDTGERTTATLAIEIQWINLESGVLYIPAVARKGKKKGRAYPLRHKTIEAIRAVIAHSPTRRFLFDFSGTMDTFYSRYEDLLKRAGLPHNRRCKPQKMRRSFATHIEAKGGNATEALDHSRRSTTKKSYLDMTIIPVQSQNVLLPEL